MLYSYTVKIWSRKIEEETKSRINEQKSRIEELISTLNFGKTSIRKLEKS